MAGLSVVTSSLAPYRLHKFKILFINLDAVCLTNTFRSPIALHIFCTFNCLLFELVASDLWPFPVALRDSCSLLRAASFHFNCTEADCWVTLLWYQIWHWASHTVIHAVREIASQLTSFLASWLIAQTGCGRMRMHEWNVLDYITRKKNNNQVKAGDEWSEPPCLLLLWFLRMNCC